MPDRAAPPGPEGEPDAMKIVERISRLQLLIQAGAEPPCVLEEDAAFRSSVCRLLESDQPVAARSTAEFCITYFEALRSLGDQAFANRERRPNSLEALRQVAGSLFQAATEDNKAARAGLMSLAEAFPQALEPAAVEIFLSAILRKEKLSEQTSSPLESVFLLFFGRSMARFLPTPPAVFGAGDHTLPDGNHFTAPVDPAEPSFSSTILTPGLALSRMLADIARRCMRQLGQEQTPYSSAILSECISCLSASDPKLEEQAKQVLSILSDLKEFLIFRASIEEVVSQDAAAGPAPTAPGREPTGHVPSVPGAHSFVQKFSSLEYVRALVVLLERHMGGDEAASQFLSMVPWMLRQCYDELVHRLIANLIISNPVGANYTISRGFSVDLSAAGGAESPTLDFIDTLCLRPELLGLALSSPLAASGPRSALPCFWALVPRSRRNSDSQATLKALMCDYVFPRQSLSADGLGGLRSAHGPGMRVFRSGLVIFGVLPLICTQLGSETDLDLIYSNLSAILAEYETDMADGDAFQPAWGREYGAPAQGGPKTVEGAAATPALLPTYAPFLLALSLLSQPHEVRDRALSLLRSLQIVSKFFSYYDEIPSCPSLSDVPHAILDSAGLAPCLSVSESAAVQAGRSGQADQAGQADQNIYVSAIRALGDCNTVLTCGSDEELGHNAAACSLYSFLRHCEALYAASDKMLSRPVMDLLNQIRAGALRVLGQQSVVNGLFVTFADAAPTAFVYLLFAILHVTFLILASETELESTLAGQLARSEGLLRYAFSFDSGVRGCFIRVLLLELGSLSGLTQALSSPSRCDALFARSLQDYANGAAEELLSSSCKPLCDRPGSVKGASPELSEPASRYQSIMNLAALTITRKLPAAIDALVSREELYSPMLSLMGSDDVPLKELQNLMFQCDITIILLRNLGGSRELGSMPFADPADLREAAGGSVSIPGLAREKLEGLLEALQGHFRPRAFTALALKKLMLGSLLLFQASPASQAFYLAGHNLQTGLLSSLRVILPALKRAGSNQGSNQDSSQGRNSPGGVPQLVFSAVVLLFKVFAAVCRGYSAESSVPRVRQAFADLAGHFLAEVLQGVLPDTTGRENNDEREFVALRSALTPQTARRLFVLTNHACAMLCALRETQLVPSFAAVPASVLLRWERWSGSREAGAELLAMLKSQAARSLDAIKRMKEKASDAHCLSEPRSADIGSSSADAQKAVPSSLAELQDLQELFAWASSRDFRKTPGEAARLALLMNRIAQELTGIPLDGETKRTFLELSTLSLSFLRGALAAADSLPDKRLYVLLYLCLMQRGEQDYLLGSGFTEQFSRSLYSMICSAQAEEVMGPGITSGGAEDDGAGSPGDSFPTSSHRGQSAILPFVFFALESFCRFSSYSRQALAHFFESPCENAFLQSCGWDAVFYLVSSVYDSQAEIASLGGVLRMPGGELNVLVTFCELLRRIVSSYVLGREEGQAAPWFAVGEAGTTSTSLAPPAPIIVCQRLLEEFCDKIVVKCFLLSSPASTAVQARLQFAAYSLLRTLSMQVFKFERYPSGVPAAVGDALVSALALCCGSLGLESADTDEYSPSERFGTARASPEVIRALLFCHSAISPMTMAGRAVNQVIAISQAVLTMSSEPGFGGRDFDVLLLALLCHARNCLPDTDPRKVDVYPSSLSRYARTALREPV